MARALSSAQQTEIAKAVTAPGYLVEIGFSVPARYSSRGAIDWNGSSWVPAEIRLAGIGTTGGAQNGQATISIGNADGAIAAMCLIESAADKSVRVWSFYGEAPAQDDPIEIFNGFGDAVAMSGDGELVQIQAYQISAGRRTIPRVRMTPENGFTNLTPAGSTITWDGERFTLEAEDA